MTARIQRWKEAAELIEQGWRVDGFNLISPTGERRSAWGNAIQACRNRGLVPAAVPNPQAPAHQPNHQATHQPEPPRRAYDIWRARGVSDATWTTFARESGIGNTRDPQHDYQRRVDTVTASSKEEAIQLANARQLVREALPSVCMWNVNSLQDMVLAKRFSVSYSFGNASPEILFQALIDLRVDSPRYLEKENRCRQENDAALARGIARYTAHKSSDRNTGGPSTAASFEHSNLPDGEASPDCSSTPGTDAPNP